MCFSLTHRPTFLLCITFFQKQLTHDCDSDVRLDWGNVAGKSGTTTLTSEIT